MKLLLDSQVLLWWYEGSPKLGRRARTTIEKEPFGVFFSAASAWELAIKSATGKLKLRDPIDRVITTVVESGNFAPLNVTIAHSVEVAKLPPHHPDPFDRLLIAQAQLEDLTIVTSDSAFDAYDVKVLDART